MANYVSRHTGSEIDTGIDMALDMPWTPLSKTIVVDDWVSNDAGNTQYKLVLGFTWRKEITDVVDFPMVWINTSDGNRYYADSATIGEQEEKQLTIYSNSNLAGTVYVFGMSSAASIK